MQGYRQITCLAYQGKRIVDSHVSGVALGTGGQIYGTLRQGNASLWPTDFHHGIKRGVGQQEGVWIRQADVFRRTDDQPAGDESWILASLHHARQPVDGAVGVGATDGLDEGGDDVVVHLPVLVVG